MRSHAVALLVFVLLAAGCVPGEGRCCRQASDCEPYLVCAFDGGAPACDGGCLGDGGAGDGGVVRFGTCRGVPYQGPGGLEGGTYGDLAPAP